MTDCVRAVRVVIAALILALVPISADAQAMTGQLGVRLIVLESDGTIDPSTEDWADADIALVVRQTREALDWWEARHPWGDLAFTLSWEVVATPYEPIMRDDIAWVPSPDGITLVVVDGRNARGEFTSGSSGFAYLGHELAVAVYAPNVYEGLYFPALVAHELAHALGATDRYDDWPPNIMSTHLVCAYANGVVHPETERELGWEVWRMYLPEVRKEGT